MLNKNSLPTYLKEVLEDKLKTDKTPVDFLISLIEENKISDLPHRCALEIKKYLDILAETCDLVLGEDRWDITFSNHANSELIYAYLVIYFEKVEITNINQKSYIKDDLYVAIRLSEEDLKLKFSYLEGFTLNLTAGELRADYVHSHLPSSAVTRMSRFCTGGDGTDFEASLVAANYSIDDEPDTIRFNYTNLILNLISLVQYESIEGTPYRYFTGVDRNTCKRLITKNENSNTINITLGETKRFISAYPIECENLIKNLDFKNIDYCLKDNKLGIVNNNKLKAELLRSMYKIYFSCQDLECLKEHIKSFLIFFKDNSSGKTLYYDVEENSNPLKDFKNLFKETYRHLLNRFIVFRNTERKFYSKELEQIFESDTKAAEFPIYDFTVLSFDEYSIENFIKIIETNYYEKNLQ